MLSSVALLNRKIDSVAAPRQVRKIKGLKWAELSDYGPFDKSRPRRACMKQGITYEKVVHRAVKRLDLGGEVCFQQWIMYADENGLGWARPDIYVLFEDITLLMEVKLSQNRTAETQLLSLYLPLLRYIYQGQFLLLQVCKSVRPPLRKLVDGPEDLLANPGPGVHVWHFLGD